ncbi:hypothetical protein D3C87_1861650 [compost metagenome]
MQTRTERQPKTNERHHQNHVAAVIVEYQLHHQNIQAAEDHSDHAPQGTHHRAAIVHREQDQHARHQRREGIAEIAYLEDDKNHCRHSAGK